MIHVYIQVTDAGSDQVGARKLIAAELRTSLFTMHISSNCVQHQQHLGFKASLLISEYVLRNMLGADIGYFSALCKLVNLWREVGLQIYQTWCASFGPLEASVAAVRARASKVSVGQVGRCAFGGRTRAESPARAPRASHG